MTIEEMRKEMRREVVPEEVVPQNVINRLIDEDAEPPKPDAFSFLMRLRALGMGSDDFLNLLEGCGAPESVINRIKNNPAMNLQGLILTLENSALTSDDYTRMLLTARQVWERTLTLRLEKSEKLSQEMPFDDADEEEDEMVKVYGAADDGSESEAEYAEDSEADEYYDEDMLEMSFTAVFDKINTETYETDPSEFETDFEFQPESEAENYPEPQNESEEEFGEEYGSGEVQSYDEEYNSGEALGYDEENDNSQAYSYGEEYESGEAQSYDEEYDSGETYSFNEEYNSDEAFNFGEEYESSEEQSYDEFATDNDTDSDTESEFTAAFDDIETEDRYDFTDETENNAEQPEPDMFSEISEDSSAVNDPAQLVHFNEQTLRENFQPLSEADDEDGSYETEPSEEPETFDERTEDVPEESSKSQRLVYHKGAMIGATIGAAVLVGAGFIVGNYLVGNDVKGIHYAADNYEVFNKIYQAYSDSEPGGGAAVGVEEDHSTIFGDLLISSEDGTKSPVGFSTGSGLYSVTEEAISVNIVENGTVTPLDDLIPPENARFVAAFDDNGELYALFSGDQSGFMKISDGEVRYTVRQDGILTDYELTDGEIRLGTVYTPNFRHTFTLNDEDVYLPRAGADELEPISAEKVIISDTNGYSYGVSAGYSTENGQVNDICAIIGDPVAASADGRFALNGENGVIVKTNGEKFITRQTEKFIYAAFGKNGCAIAENINAKNNIRLLDNDLNNASVLTGIAEDINVMRFDGSFLTISCTNSIYRIDCSDIIDPEPLKLNIVNGIVSGQSVLTFDTSGAALLITRYDIKDGVTEKIGEYSKNLTAQQLATVKPGDAKTAVIDGSKSGIAYSYFDGVSVISEYVLFADGEQPKTVLLFDDKTGFTAAFKNGSKINAICAEGVKAL